MGVSGGRDAGAFLNIMDEITVEKWLSRYGQAWERKETEAFVTLFSPDVRYHWTPFEDPKEGREELAQAFESAVARQEAIRFKSTVLSAEGRSALTHWHCSFDRGPTGQRVELDGIFHMEFDSAGRCQVFREWWHSDELT